MPASDTLKIGLVQMASVWLDRTKMLYKVATYLSDAAAQKCDLVTFGEALVPGYPFCVELTDGAVFNNPAQKQMYATYLEQGVVIERGDLKALCKLCKLQTANDCDVSRRDGASAGSWRARSVLHACLRQ